MEFYSFLSALVCAVLILHWQIANRRRYSLLSAKRLKQLIADGVIQGVDPSQVNAASIDVRLGDTILWERRPHADRRIIDLKARQPLDMDTCYMDEAGYLLQPGEFILASTIEKFNLPPNISAQFQLKSSGARIGLEHLKAGWCDAGWHGSVLTLELLNVTRHHSIRLRPGDRIGQLVFFEHEPVAAEHSYATLGSYNKDATVSGAKPK